MPNFPFFSYPQNQAQHNNESGTKAESNARTGAYNQESLYIPIDHHWFYLKKDPTGKELWNPFSKKDSMTLEEAYNEANHGMETTDVVSVMGSRYDVHIGVRLCYPVYWSEEPYPVRRSGWFVKNQQKKAFNPFDEVISAKLEEEYKKCCLNNHWQHHVNVGDGDVVIFNTQNSFIQRVQASEFYSRNRFNSVKRSIPESQKLPEDETENVDHLVFLVPGIGPRCGLKFRPVVEVVDNIREMSSNLLSNIFGNSIISGAVNRVEFLPVDWHDLLRSDETGIDKKIKDTTLESIPIIRRFANNVVVDALLYMSPAYSETIASTVAVKLNRIYNLFKERNPGFSGRVSLGGHSMGCLILFDILSHQPESSTKIDDALSVTEDNQLDIPSLKDICEKLRMEDILPIFMKEKLDYKTLLVCGDSDFKDLGLTIGQRVQLKAYLRDVYRKTIQRKIKAGHEAHTSSVGNNLTKEGTEQLSIEFPKIEFETENLFAWGSPISIFVTVRGIKTLGPNFKFPTCRKMFNIFHPHDPIAYRIEPLIDPQMAAIPPVLIPHHKGRKRIHKEFQETVSRYTLFFKQKYQDSLKTTISTVQNNKTISRIPVLSSFVKNMETSQEVETPVRLKPGSSISGSIKNAQESSSDKCDCGELAGQNDQSTVDMRFVSLNEGRRMDYVLQESPLESVSEYVFAMFSHLSYWQSEDTVLLILKEIYSDVGIGPESVPVVIPKS